MFYNRATEGYEAAVKRWSSRPRNPSWQAIEDWSTRAYVLPVMATFLDHFATALADRYRLDHEIGRGGMAVVYLAHDLRPELQRRVAIKVLHPELSSALAVERFLQEINVAGNLVHPHILPLHDSGTVSYTHLTLPTIYSV